MTTGTPRTVVVRGWPGLDCRPAPAPDRGASTLRLGEANALFVHAAADPDADGDQHGLAVAVLAAGRSLIAGAIVMPDDLGARDRSALAEVVEWSRTHGIDTPRGRRPWDVLTSSEFFDPRAPADGGGARFTPNAFGSRRLLVGYGLGRFVGLMAEHVAASRGGRSGSWTAYLPGWCAEREDGSRYRAFPDRPELRITARRVGFSLRWGPTERGRGRRGGEAIDLASLAYALGAPRGASYADVREVFGLDRRGLAQAVRVDAAGAERLVGDVLGLHALAQVLDERAASW